MKHWQSWNAAYSSRANINEIDSRALSEDVKRRFKLSIRGFRIERGSCRMQNIEFPKVFKDSRQTRKSRKDLPICGSQFESGYKSE